MPASGASGEVSDGAAPARALRDRATLRRAGKQQEIILQSIRATQQTIGAIKRASLSEEIERRREDALGIVRDVDAAWKDDAGGARTRRGGGEGVLFAVRRRGLRQVAASAARDGRRARGRREVLLQGRPGREV